MSYEAADPGTDPFADSVRVHTGGDGKVYLEDLETGAIAAK